MVRLQQATKHLLRWLTYEYKNKEGDDLRITDVTTDDQMNDPEHLPMSDITPPCPRSKKELTKETVTVTHTVGIF